MVHWISCIFFFFNDTATTEIYTLSLHDALPICDRSRRTRRRDPHRAVGAAGRASERPGDCGAARAEPSRARRPPARSADRKSTRLNSSHANISYAVFCLKKKKK